MPSRILSRLEAAGYEAWLVGGCVRDRLMGIEPHDFDITTSATPDEVLSVFAGERVIETGRKHGTLTIVLGGTPFEVTTFRAESAYSDHRHPDAVRFTRSLRDDLARRDFTMNAIAMDARGAICDPFGGQADLAAGCIRCVGAPEARFGEDALRILRALRFASRLGFAIEPATARAIGTCRELLRAISAERVANELTGLLCGEFVRPVLMTYVQTLAVVLPELAPLEGFDQRNYHHIYDVLEHTARVVEAVPPEPALRLAALFHDAGKPHCFTLDEDGVGHFYGHAEVSRQLADAALGRLRFDNATRRTVDELIRAHDLPIEPTPRAVRRAMHRHTPEGLRQLLALKRADNLAQSPEFQGRLREYAQIEAIADQIEAEAQCFCLHDLAVNGRDLIALGVLPGPAVGAILASLLDAVLSEALPNDRPTLLAAAREMIRE